MEDSGVKGFTEDKNELTNEREPCLGMEFESEESAFKFYNEYGGVMGFGIRRDYHTKSKKDGVMINRKFVCCKEGETTSKQPKIITQGRRETRTNCKAFMYVSFDRSSSKWVVTKFDNRHNHILRLPDCVHMMPSRINLCEEQGIDIEIANATGLSLEAPHDLLSSEAVDDVDPKLVISTRYRHLSSKMVKLAAQASKYDAAYELVDDAITDLCTKVDSMIIALESSGASSSGNHIDFALDGIDPNFERVKGLRKKDISAHKGGGRLTPWHVKIGKKKKVVIPP